MKPKKDQTKEPTSPINGALTSAPQKPPQQENAEWEKRFCEQFCGSVKPHEYGDCHGALSFSSVKSFIRDLLSAERQKRELPMGVSQWMNHGKEYGYWKYFEQKTREEAFCKEPCCQRKPHQYVTSNV